MKIIDQTNFTIKRSEGPVKRKTSLPGTSTIKTKKTKSPTKDKSKSWGEQNQEFSVREENNPNYDNNAYFSLLHQELETFMQPAKSFGVDLDNDTFNFSDEEQRNQKWRDLMLESFEEVSENLNPLKGQYSPTAEFEEPYSYEESTVQSEFRLTIHYCRVMCEFYSVKDPKWNIYSMISSKLAYRYVPLQHSLLAWSGLHLSIQENSSDTISKRYFQSALSLTMKEKFLESSVPVEFLLATAFFLCIYGLMEGQGNTCYILRHVWSTLGIGNLLEQDGIHQNNGTKFSPFAYQMITWLIYLDIRSSLFIGNISFPDYIALDKKKNSIQRKNSDVKYLTESDMYESKAVSNIFRNSRNVLSSSYGSSYPSENLSNDKVQDQLLVLMVRNMLLLGSLVRLRCWIESCGNSTEFDPQSLKSKIDIMYKECEQLQFVDDKDITTRFHILIINSLIHSSIIYFDRICHPDILTNERSQQSVSAIMKIAFSLKDLRGIKTPGSVLWPFPLFIAGIETRDVIYKNWILEELHNYESECWGHNIAKTKVLIKRCWEKQEETNTRVDIGPIMNEATGYFMV